MCRNARPRASVVTYFTGPAAAIGDGLTGLVLDRAACRFCQLAARAVIGYTDNYRDLAGGLAHAIVRNNEDRRRVELSASQPPPGSTLAAFVPWLLNAADAVRLDMIELITRVLAEFGADGTQTVRAYGLTPGLAADAGSGTGLGWDRDLILCRAEHVEVGGVFIDRTAYTLDVYLDVPPSELSQLDGVSAAVRRQQSAEVRKIVDAGRQ